MDAARKGSSNGIDPRRRSGRHPVDRALRLLALAAILLPGFILGCEGGTTVVTGSFTVGCGTVDESECPPHWTLTVAAHAASDGQPVAGALATVSRGASVETVRTDATGRAYLPETGSLSPCSVLCGDLFLGTTDCLAWGQTDELTSVAVSASGYASRSGTVVLTRDTRDVLLTLGLTSLP